MATSEIAINPEAPDDHWVSPSGSDCWCKVGQLKHLVSNLQWSVCRLYDAELITSSRACELLSCKMQDFRALYVEFSLNPVRP